jgi:hypothetical protein
MFLRSDHVDKSKLFDTSLISCFLMAAADPEQAPDGGNSFSPPKRIQGDKQDHDSAERGRALYGKGISAQPGITEMIL